MNDINEASEPEITADSARNDIVVTTYRKRWLLGCLCGAGLLAAMFAVSYFTARYVTPQVVTFDMKGTMDIFIQQSAQQKLDEDSAKQLVARFNAAMSNSLADWQQKHNAVILVQPAVVSAQPDITGDIREAIAARMKERP
ncbi:type-F conjugative transfer system protein TrbI [Kosakonia sacchari]|uniref:Type-F conjugative transfer system protein TrbI n=1 Tax=Kosakonia sacchari TaxID=1158459 RepID=A0ABZ0MYA0_9ENTR|nr:type-F conjugative transfer system protein TrbI [Kosakonia sacchari]WOZ79942.1 type-F conjugative transfer system protein TrbI [Kosakonia sacchari]